MTTYSEVGTLSSGVVASVALTADTEITVSTVTMPRAGTIYEVEYNFGNVVDAKAMSGYLEVKSNLQTGPWRFPVGFGAGGAATIASRNFPGKIPVNIPVKQNEIITITMTMTEAGVDAHAAIKWMDGAGGGPKIYGDCNTAEDASITAATLETTSTITIPAGKGGRIKEIRCAIANVVNAKDVAGYLDVRLQNREGPFRFLFGGGGGGATNSGGQMEPCRIPCDIPVDANEVVTIWIYSTDALVEGHTGIVWVAGA